MMLRNWFRFFGAGSYRSNQPPTPSQPQITLFANIEPASFQEQEKDVGGSLPDQMDSRAIESSHPGPRVQALPSKSNVSRGKPSSNHRARLLSMRLEHIQLCSPHRCARLQQLGIVTAGDLAYASPERLAIKFRASRRALRVLKEYRRAIRFAASVPGMMPRDAMLLINVHRRSVRGLSMESATTLRRDLDRFAASSQGQACLRGRRLPSTRRLKRWINQCREASLHSPAHVRSA